MTKGRVACRGGYIKREGRPTEVNTLTSRLIDRPLRPLVPNGWAYDTQVLLWLLSYDERYPPQPHAITAAAASLLVSDVPFNTACAGIQVGRIDGKIVLNPGVAAMEHSDLDLTMAGTAKAVLMIEGFADFLPEDVVLEAIAAGHEAIAKICKGMEVRVV
jgi:polyribonucleotide nucleotidyltransferase